ncbi:DUF2919 family protein [Methylibium petroleiphilum]|uniref:DUF2919 family protein n=1 Tax=Methylibium petroleiphilum TaxID=105560 RepID=UPI003D2ADDAF
MADNHSPHDVAFQLDRHGVLRVPGLLWIAMALLARHWVLLILVAVSARREGSATLLLGNDGVPWAALGMEIPIVLLAFAAFYRQPNAGAWARLLWRRGREIVALTAALNIGWTVNLLLKSDYWLPWPELFLISCSVLDTAIALSMYKTPYFRQLFSEFPTRPDAKLPPP